VVEVRPKVAGTEGPNWCTGHTEWTKASQWKPERNDRVMYDALRVRAQ
jgi:hypothetical protein